MANNNYISRSKFQEIFSKALSKCNIPQEEQDKFFEEGSTLQLRNLGICITITNIIDNIIKKELPDYDGCFSCETFNTIYEYNKQYIYERELEREQERKREENA